jgi:hypothetical protein
VHLKVNRPSSSDSGLVIEPAISGNNDVVTVILGATRDAFRSDLETMPPLLPRMARRAYLSAPIGRHRRIYFDGRNGETDIARWWNTSGILAALRSKVASRGLQNSHDQRHRRINFRYLVTVD